jgi:hypothetical protein
MLFIKQPRLKFLVRILLELTKILVKVVQAIRSKPKTKVIPIPAKHRYLQLGVQLKHLIQREFSGFQAIIHLESLLGKQRKPAICKLILNKYDPSGTNVKSVKNDQVYYNLPYNVE